MKGVYKTEFKTPEGCDPVLWNMVNRNILQQELLELLGDDAPKVETPSVEELLKDKE